MKSPSSRLAVASPGFRRVCQVALFPALIFILTMQSAFAGSATWKSDPPDNNWNNAANWTPETVPNGPDDVASLGVSNQPDIAVSAATEVAQIVFSPGASIFTITCGPSVALTISGAGMTNNSGVEQNFVVATDASDGGALSFTNAATAGDQTVYTVNGGTALALLNFYGTSAAGTASFVTNESDEFAGVGGIIEFYDNSTADHGTFVNTGSTILLGGAMYFYDNSRAGEATFVNEAATDEGIFGGSVNFYDATSADNATFINEGSAVAGGGGTEFNGYSNAADATLILQPSKSRLASAGELFFEQHASAGNATIISEKGPKNYNEGRIQIDYKADGGTCRMELLGSNSSVIFGLVGRITIGSVEGRGEIDTNGDQISIGSNNLDTVFSGVITGPGSLSKGGRGRTVLTGANTYTGTNDPVAGTTILRGVLLVNNTTGSGTGAGSVLVRGGTLGGTGTIAGPVEIGDGIATGAILNPGDSKEPFALLTLQSDLSIAADGTLRIKMNSEQANMGAVVANGVTISGAQFSIIDLGNALLPLGNVFTAINNTASTPISGTFSNLADGGTITVGSNTLQADYEGGDGNDLTLTVVP